MRNDWITLIVFCVVIALEGAWIMHSIDRIAAAVGQTKGCPK